MVFLQNSSISNLPKNIVVKNFTPFHVHILVHFSPYQCTVRFDFGFPIPKSQSVVRIQNPVNIAMWIASVHAIYHFRWKKCLQNHFLLDWSSFLFYYINFTLTHHANPDLGVSYVPINYQVDHRNLDGIKLFAHFCCHSPPQLDIHPNKNLGNIAKQIWQMNANLQNFPKLGEFFFTIFGKYSRILWMRYCQDCS